VPAPVEVTPAARHVIELVRRRGPVPFSTFVDVALYDPDHGFYTGGGGAGRRRDFITSPEVGPLFGAVMARALDTWWTELGEPDPYVVVEAGAGVGTLAVSVLAAAPRCAPALHYVLVERSAELRARHRTHLALVDPSVALGSGPGDGPLVTSLAELPSGPLTGVVLANELLDNLAVDLLAATPAGWEEVRIGVDADDRLVEVNVPATAADVGRAEQLAPAARPGRRIPVHRQAAAWLGDALGALERGRVVVIDYATPLTADLAARPPADWLRTYRGHERAGGPLDAPGTADITVEVAIDQLVSAVGPVDVDRSQAGFLRAFGIDELVAAGRQEWHARAAVADLDALRARSRVREAEALLDPGGLGSFRVVEWARP